MKFIVKASKRVNVNYSCSTWGQGGDACRVNK